MAIHNLQLKVSNSYFQFKKFRIEQGQTAMKVCTEACIFGACVDIFKILEIENTIKILDIGAGTGILSLMLAQRITEKFTESTNNQTLIDAVELEEKAFLQAQENIKNSVFSDKIDVFNASIQDFAEIFIKENPKKYDLIVSNPPFFSNHLLSKTANKNLALHTNTLSFEDLAKSVSQLLHQNGTFEILLPAYEMSLFEQIAHKYNLQITKKLTIFNTEKHKENNKIFRKICTLKFNVNVLDKNIILEGNLVIKSEENHYTDSFKGLLKEFYLHL